MGTDPQVHPFDELVSRPEADVRLATAALLFARDEYDQVDPEFYLGQLDDLARRVAAHPASSPAGRVESLRHVLVEQEDFRGDEQSYHSADSSYLNCVIDKRRGLPIALAVIWIDVARTLDWPIHGVGLPGHFILSYDSPDDRILIDPFHNGVVVNPEDCRQIVRAMFGRAVPFEREQLRPVSTFAILERMLGNLYTLYVQQRDWLRAARVLTRTIALRPGSFAFRAELGRTLIEAGELAAAEVALAEAMSLTLGTEEREALDAHYQALRQARVQRN
ncbi:MAG TPA: transglutaminase-like domain-containing protein [Phycisphaerae bacterium]|nr:transglutaminase-like domain-containing protein [Phycisphaerae bacterium]